MNGVKIYHLIGIGGIGMSGIARLMIARGIRLSGSDAKQSQTTDELAAIGCRISIGHRPGNIDGCDEIIFSSAISEDNPELKEARRRGIPVRKRAQALAELMQDKRVITVTGAHGKTTTSSLAAHLLLCAGLSPTVAVGGIIRNIGNNAFDGQGDFFVAEADESDGSFLCYRPEYSVITNIDREHLDYYRDFDRLLDSFRGFIAQTSPRGCLFCCGQDVQLRKMLAGHKGRSITYGFGDDLDVRASGARLEGLSSEFDCFRKGEFLARFRLNLGGVHNICNSLAVIALGLELGIGLGTIVQALETYQGAGRRLEVKLRSPVWTVIDDYAHHPTEIRATLEAVSRMDCRRRFAIFQPHRYTRTSLLLDDFGTCFAGADPVFITDIYPAAEPPIEGVNAELVASKIRGNFPGKQVEYVAKDRLCEKVLAAARPGDLIITLGAGDITRISDEIVRSLKTRG